jgi:hypothetical protein
MHVGQTVTESLLQYDAGDVGHELMIESSRRISSGIVVEDFGKNVLTWCCAELLHVLDGFGSRNDESHHDMQCLFFAIVVTAAPEIGTFHHIRRICFWTMTAVSPLSSLVLEQFLVECFQLANNVVAFHNDKIVTFHLTFQEVSCTGICQCHSGPSTALLKGRVLVGLVGQQAVPDGSVCRHEKGGRYGGSGVDWMVMAMCQWIGKKLDIPHREWLLLCLLYGCLCCFSLPFCERVRSMCRRLMVVVDAEANVVRSRWMERNCAKLRESVMIERDPKGQFKW